MTLTYAHLVTSVKWLLVTTFHEWGALEPDGLTMRHKFITYCCMLSTKLLKLCLSFVILQRKDNNITYFNVLFNTHVLSIYWVLGGMWSG